MSDHPKLQPPDSQFLMAAVGWIELGLCREAETELRRIAAAYQDHPDVLEVRWLVCAELKDWATAREVAEALVSEAPERDSGWVHRAYSLRRAPGGGLPAAWDALLPAAEKFPKNHLILYNLACYAAQLGHPDDAFSWLKKAVKAAGDAQTIKRMALADEDLKPLWDRLREL